MTKVSDGDTITIEPTVPVEEEKGKSIKVRLFGIDAPESKQPTLTLRAFGLKKLCWEGG